jgi:hypothetical protein
LRKKVYEIDPLIKWTFTVPEPRTAWSGNQGPGAENQVKFGPILFLLLEPVLIRFYGMVNVRPRKAKPTKKLITVVFDL